MQKYHSRQISRISVRKKISSSRFLLPVMELLQSHFCAGQLLKLFRYDCYAPELGGLVPSVFDMMILILSNFICTFVLKWFFQQHQRTREPEAEEAISSHFCTISIHFAVSSVWFGSQCGVSLHAAWCGSPCWTSRAIFSVPFFLAANIREVADVKDLSTFSATARAFGTKRVR